MLSTLRACRLFSLFIFVILLGSQSFALSEPERDELRMMPEWIPYVGCRDGRALLQCVTWSSEECEGTTEALSRQCLNLYQPDWMNPSRLTLEDWKERISACVMREVKRQYKTRLVDSLVCRNKGMIQ